MPQCYTCKVDKELDEFSKRNSKLGRVSNCKLCEARYKKAYYNKNKARWRELFLDKHDSPQGRLSYLVRKSKERGKADGVEHSITEADLQWVDTCPYLGIQLTHEFGKGQLQTNASLDRIDSTKGYVPGNVQIVSRKANTMKSSASAQELLTFARSVLALHETPDST